MPRPGLEFFRDLGVLGMILLILTSGMTGCAAGRGEAGKPFPDDRPAEMKSGAMVF